MSENNTINWVDPPKDGDTYIDKHTQVAYTYCYGRWNRLNEIETMTFEVKPMKKISEELIGDLPDEILIMLQNVPDLYVERNGLNYPYVEYMKKFESSFAEVYL